VSQQQLLAQLNAAYSKMSADYARGDYAAAGQEQGVVLNLLGEYLRKYGSLPGTSSSPRASPSPSGGR
jgi:hypothetical protein